MKIRPDFEKSNGLIPVIIQDSISYKVLMLGYMNEEAYLKSLEEGIVTFYSRSKSRLWTKGETSGNFFRIKNILNDCDNDTLLILVKADGNACHLGNESCFYKETQSSGFLPKLESIIDQRIVNQVESSYSYQLYAMGIEKTAQKVGEEAVELVIEAMKKDNTDRFIDEAADLIYHLLILLKVKGTNLKIVEERLFKRSR